MASIQKRGDNSFLLVVEAGYNAKGKRIRRTKTIRIKDPALLKTKKKLNDYLNDELVKFKIEVESGEYIAPEKMILKDFISEWEQKYAEKELGEQTLANYLGHIKNHIIPSLGHMKLEQIKPLHIINFINDIKRKKNDGELSSGTIENIYKITKNIFERATEWKIIKENPVASVKKPKVQKTVRTDVYDEKEIEQLFVSVQNEPIYWQVFASLALAAGLRRSELLGLEWKNVDFETGVIDVVQVIVKGKSGRPVIKEPKTKNSKRKVSLPQSVVEELRRYHLHWKKEKLSVGDDWLAKDNEFVFCREDGLHYHPQTPTAWWIRFTKKANIRHIRLHDLRHTSATLLINQGVHAKIISSRLGHSNIGITMDIYGHALQSADQQAAEKLDSLFKKREAN
ncbi:tyrosine-type recombinase/integrase [Metabacillus fastidiosus]|uniref:tyrosine-type recombinase/integrase n=1 Tax=Metabacillus fastidiosus TaxID=1458 RepID=UPI003D2BFE20